MSVTRDKRNGTWYVQAWYKTYDGKRAHKVKRGFKTKPEALAWERDFYAVQAGDMDMKLVDFLELYKKDMGPRLRLNTWKTKESIITKRILPYLGEKRMNQIAPVDVVRWQNELMAFEKPGRGGFSATYLKTVNNQLCALFNHAVRFYGLSSNPCRRAESMGSKSAGEMRFWTKGQYLRFSDEIMDKPLSFHAFETLYWCGMREGELLALKPRRFDFERGTLTVAESYQRIDGQDVLTDPKTPKSKRVIATCPNSARERSVTIGFRVTPEQARRIDLMARTSGMTKQDYLYKRALEEEVVVRPDVRVYKMLRDEMGACTASSGAYGPPERSTRGSPGRSTSSRGSSPPCAARRSPRTSSGRTPSSSGCRGGSPNHPSFCALRGCPPAPQGQQVSQMCGRSPHPLPLRQSGVYCPQCEKPSGF